MNYQNLKLEKQNRVATVWLSREKALNALNADLLKELKNGFETLSEDREVWAVILTGAGEKAFVAGADIAAMSQMSPDQASEFGRLGHEVMSAVENCKKPVIAAVNGFCLGGGLELALSCDFIYASERAKLGLPEVGLGLFPGWGGTQRLTRLLGKNRAKEIIITGLMNEVRAAAAEICKKGPVAVSLAKKLMNEACNTSLVDGLANERKTFPECFKTEDTKEGLAAFLEKRAANFKGK
ncbi:MAG: enoyl-CoA hydratase/isomerase family protein [Deltaproteobacteria bacterium]|nr:enoyl-CoA hydratase/isomerase family protein [Deltaproteobacteria bacterium]